jgi:AsmA family/AsmA-like C-terminal region
MASKARRHARNFLIALALLAAGGWLGPRFFGVEHYRAQLQSALERALGRPVSFGTISLHFLPRPGFTLENVVVGELPQFGFEPFGRAERLDCALRWRSLWQACLSISSLTLQDASLNLVRDDRGEWNIEGLLVKNGAGSQGDKKGVSGGAISGLEVLVRNARLNFKTGQDKRPFAITDVKGRVHIDLAPKQIRFQLSGSPVRTDLPYPTPGEVELTGAWSPDGAQGGQLDATLRARQTLLYNWIPLVLGSNPGIYGVVDSEIRLTGSLRDPQFDGEMQLTQLHRWEQLPPETVLPCSLHFRADFNRDIGQVRIASLDLAFASSQMHLAGTVSDIPSASKLDLVLGIERSRLRDMAELYQHLTGGHLKGELAGRVDGMLTVRGAWGNLHYGGFISGRQVRLATPFGTFPTSEIALRIEGHHVQLAPVKVLLAPHVEAVADGSIEMDPQNSKSPWKLGPPDYELTLGAQSVPLHDLLRFARGLGLDLARNLDAQGVGTLRLQLSGRAWPFTRPQISAHALIQSARLLLPGLTEPLNVPRAEVSIRGSRIVAAPVVAVMGTSVFTGRVEHDGRRQAAWKFTLMADHLNLGQGARWFDVLGERAPAPLLQHLPGISSFVERRQAAASLFDRLNAQGRFSTAALTYQAITLHHFSANVVVQDRVVRVESAAFRAGGGRGSGNAVIDLGKRPALLTTDLALVGARIGALAKVLPERLQQASGTYSARGHFETRGLSHSEMISNLNGTASIVLRRVALGRFDLIGALAEQAGFVVLRPPSGPSLIELGKASLTVANRSVELQDGFLKLRRARLGLQGSYAFNGHVRLNVQADLREFEPPWSARERTETPGARLARLGFSGTFSHLVKSSPRHLPRPDR